MKAYELADNQRPYFGLDPVGARWDRVVLKGDRYRPDSILYFDGDTIKRHIVSTDDTYCERQYDEKTKGRSILLPKTGRGKELKLSASVLEKRQPTGVYLDISCGVLTLGNYTTQTAFYSSSWDKGQISGKTIPDMIAEFIAESPQNHIDEVTRFKNSKRKNVKYRPGDYFRFKLDRMHFGFGRILLDVNKIRKKNLIDEFHGLRLLMGPPVIVEFFAFKSREKDVDIAALDEHPRLPADVMMDNLLLYGEYEIIGHREIKDEEYDFPISYGRSLDRRSVVFLQWGLIHRELPREIFCKYIAGEKDYDQNPYGYYSIGFRPAYDSIEVLKAVDNGGLYDFNRTGHYRAKWDLRNPRNRKIRNELFEAFGLDPGKNYHENCLLTGTPLPGEVMK